MPKERKWAPSSTVPKICYNAIHRRAASNDHQVVNLSTSAIIFLQNLSLQCGFVLCPIWKYSLQWEQIIYRVSGGKRSKGGDMELCWRVNSHPSAEIGLTLEENMDQILAWTSLHETKSVLLFVCHLGKLWSNIWHGEGEAQGSKQRWRKKEQQQWKTHCKISISGILWYVFFFL